MIVVVIVKADGTHAGKVKGKETCKLTRYGQIANAQYKKGATITVS